ncbi:2OG-Fe(II) oxygenase superfamily protein [Mycena capillaripes]|nr:2OG-Fe(II) oxygenase superfamily protein [Mycena capillaripes]
MPVLAKPELKPWIVPNPTQADLDWAPLPLIDLSKWDTPGGKEALARDLTGAARDIGFWTVTNSGIPEELINKQFSLANAFFQLPHEEKTEVKFVLGESYYGYREPRNVGSTTQKENLEFFVPGSNFPRHQFVASHENEIAAFQRMVFDLVISKMLMLVAIILELPEDTFVNMHLFESANDDHLRYMRYLPQSVEDDNVATGQWLAGHTDFGSMTLLFPQPISACVQMDEGWKWVKYVEGGIVVNGADLLSILTKGYIKSAVHRVVRPPPDQDKRPRLGVALFVRPMNDVIIKPYPSPVLRREGLWTQEDDDFTDKNAPTCAEYIAGRAHKFNVTRTLEMRDEVVRIKNLEVLNKY